MVKQNRCNTSKFRNTISQNYWVISHINPFQRHIHTTLSGTDRSQSMADRDVDIRSSAQNQGARSAAEGQICHLRLRQNGKSTGERIE